MIDTIIEEVWIKYKLEMKGLSMSLINGFVVSVSELNLKDELNMIASIATPLVTIFTLLVLIFTVIKLADKFICVTYRFSIFRMKKITDDNDCLINGKAKKDRKESR